MIDKIGAVFESYWREADFEWYDRERFMAAQDARCGARQLAEHIELRLEPFQKRRLEEVELSAA